MFFLPALPYSPTDEWFFFFAATALHDEILPVAVRVPFSSL
jgi:hypothetical protein